MKTSKLILAGLSSAIIAVGIMTVMPVQTKPQPAAAAQTCPAGSYDIGISKDGQPICKLEPTGCPYGDSIPMDMCAKFEPQPVQAVEPAPTVTPAPQAAQCGGK